MSSLFATVGSVLSVMRLAPFDPSTQGGRSQERYRRAALTAVGSAGAKGASFLTSLISVPLAIRYLGPERYGLWITVTSVSAVLAFADFGMGSGLMNAVAEASGRDDREAARRYVSSALLMLSGVALAVAMGFALVYRFVPWARVFNVSSSSAVSEAGPAVAVFVVFCLLSIPLGIVQRVQMAYQEGFRANIWQAAGSALALAGVLLAIRLRCGLSWLVAALSGGPVVALALNGWAEFRWAKPWLSPSRHCFDWRSARKITGMGVLFVVLQVAAALILTSDNIVIAQVLGAAAVAQYAVPMRLFDVLGSAAGILFMPLWPAYGEALARGDLRWVRKTVVRSQNLTLLICGLPAALLVVFGKSIIHLWVGPTIQPTHLLLAGMAAWTLFLNLGGVLAIFLNGANLMRFQVACAIPMAVISVILKIWLARRAGLPGVIWGNAIAYFLLILLPFLIFIPRFLSRWQLRPVKASLSMAE